MSVEKRVFSAAAGGVADFVVGFLNSIALVPVLLSYWGKESYGTWLSLSALLAMLSTLDAGHHYYIRNELCRSFADPEKRTHEFRKILASGFRMAVILGSVELSLLLIIHLFGFLPLLLGTSAQIVASQRLFLALSVMVLGWVLTGSVGGLLGGMYLATGLLSRGVWIMVFGRILSTVIIAACALAGGSVLAVASVLNISGLAVLFFFASDLQKRFPEYFPFWRGGSWKLGWHNLKRSVVMTMTLLLPQWQTSGLLIRVSSSLGTAMVPAFTTLRTLGNTFLQFNNIAVTPLSPEMIRYNVKREADKLAGTWAVVWWCVGGLTNVGLLISLLMIEPFYFAWTRGQLSFYWSFYLMIGWLVSLQACNLPLNIYLNATNQLRATSMISVVQTGATLGLATAALSRYGLIGIALALIAGELLGPTLISRYFAYKNMERLQGRFPMTQDFCSMLASVAVGCIFWTIHQKWLRMPQAVGIGIPILLGFYVIQWMVLPPTIRHRIFKLLPTRLRLPALSETSSTP